MGVRFNKRIKVLPYVTANVGKSGISLTIGPKGKTLNIGSTGVTVNVSLGKGVGYSKRLISWRKLNLLSWLGIGGAAATKAVKGKAKGKKGTTTPESSKGPISLDDAIAEAEGRTTVEQTVEQNATINADDQQLQEQAGCGPVGIILGILAVLVILALVAAVVWLFIKLQAQTA